MKILLIGINAKYIHSNPAIYSLRACAGTYKSAVEIAEYTINQHTEDIRKDIYLRKPDVIAVSCYIWNWAVIAALLPDVAKLMPGVPIWLGGPEVSYRAEEVLAEFPQVTGIMVGEGEYTFRRLAESYHKRLCLGRSDMATDLNLDGGSKVQGLDDIPHRRFLILQTSLSGMLTETF